MHWCVAVPGRHACQATLNPPPHTHTTQVPVDTNLGITSMSGGCATPWGSGLVFENWVPDARQFETMATTGERCGPAGGRGGREEGLPRPAAALACHSLPRFRAQTPPPQRRGCPSWVTAGRLPPRCCAAGIVDPEVQQFVRHFGIYPGSPKMIQAIIKEFNPYYYGHSIEIKIGARQPPAAGTWQRPPWSRVPGGAAQAEAFAPPLEPCPAPVLAQLAGSSAAAALLSPAPPSAAADPHPLPHYHPPLCLCRQGRLAAAQQVVRPRPPARRRRHRHA
jgi:hypothetical protein